MKTTSKLKVAFYCILFTITGSVQAKEVIMEEAGTLSTLITSEEKETIEELTVSGPINGADLLFIREMAGTDINGTYGGYETMPDYTIYYTPLGGSLKTLNLTDAQIVEGEDQYYSKEATENDVVGNHMFDMCLNLQYVTLPETITKVGDFAFAACQSLKEVTIPDGVTSIGMLAFTSCYSLENVTIGAGVTSIGDVAFDGCKNLQSITFNGTTVPTIGGAALASVPKTCIIYVPDDATKAAFEADSNFEGYTIEVKEQTTTPTLVKEVVMEEAGTLSTLITFEEKETIEELTVSGPINGADLLFIREMAGTDINGTYGGYETMPDYTIYYTPLGGSLKTLNLTDAQIVEGDDQYYSKESTENDVVGNHMFDMCLNLQYVTLPETITKVGDFAFAACQSLKEVTIPDGVTSIGMLAFTSCYSLENVTIGAGVTSIGDVAFDGCKNLQSITFNGTTVPTIGGAALASVPKTCIIYVPDTATKAAFEADSNFEGYTIEVKEQATTPTLVKEIVMEEAGTLSTLITSEEKETIEELTVSGPINGADILFIREMAGTDINGNYGGYETMPDYTFYYTPLGGSLKKLNLADAQIVEGEDQYYSKEATENDVVGNHMFDMCLNLQYVTLPETITKVGDFAFAACQSLKEVTIPDGVTSIGMLAFTSCYSLENVTIGAGVTFIGDVAFDGCKNLQSITFNGTTVPTIGGGALASVPKTCIIYVPDTATKAAFEADPNFEGYTIVAKEQTTAPTLVKEVVMEEAGTLSTLITAEEKETIEELTVSGPINGADILFIREMAGTDINGNYGGIETMPDYTFYYTPLGGSLKKLNLADAQIVEGEDQYYSKESTENDVVGNHMFDMCLNLQYVTLPETITKVGDFAFAACQSLKEVTIPDGVTSIGMLAFTSCYSLENVTIGAGVTSIGDVAFDGCKNLQSITFNGTTVPAIGNSALASVPKTCIIYVPDLATKAAFEADPNFEGYTIIAKDAGVADVSGNHTAVRAYNGHVEIETSVPSAVCIITLQGQVLYNQMVQNTASINLATGLYIITVGDDTYKTFVK